MAQVSSENNKKPLLILIVGPTAVGKTSTSIALANYFEAEIISADSRQFYKQMTIGTAKPTVEEREDAVHHFVDFLDLDQYYSAGDFERDVDKFLNKYFQKKKVVIMCGGSGLYIKAALEGLDSLPRVPPEFRNSLMERLQNEPLANLFEELKALDPQAAIEIDAGNTQRVVRALEVCLFTHQAFSSFKLHSKKFLQFDVIKIGLERPREELYARIDMRVDEMIKSGLQQEVHGLESFRNLNALQTVGYKEFFDFFDKKENLVNTIAKIKQSTRKYAKRQLTWFKNKENCTWFNPDEYSSIQDYVSNRLF